MKSAVTCSSRAQPLSFGVASAGGFLTPNSAGRHPAAARERCWTAAVIARGLPGCGFVQTMTRPEPPPGTQQTRVGSAWSLLLRWVGAGILPRSDQQKVPTGERERSGRGLSLGGRQLTVPSRRMPPLNFEMGGGSLEISPAA